MFYLEARDGTAGFVLRYSLKDENYYLRVYSNSKVKLRVSSQALVTIGLLFNTCYKQSLVHSCEANSPDDPVHRRPPLKSCS